jgi:hypothetical protein
MRPRGEPYGYRTLLALQELGEANACSLWEYHQTEGIIWAL